MKKIYLNMRFMLKHKGDIIIKTFKDELEAMLAYDNRWRCCAGSGS